MALYIFLSLDANRRLRQSQHCTMMLNLVNILMQQENWLIIIIIIIIGSSPTHTTPNTKNNYIIINTLTPWSSRVHGPSWCHRVGIRKLCSILNNDCAGRYVKTITRLTIQTGRAWLSFLRHFLVTESEVFHLKVISTIKICPCAAELGSDAVGETSGARKHL